MAVPCGRRRRFRPVRGHANALLGNDPKSGLFDQRVDRARQVARGRVGLERIEKVRSIAIVSSSKSAGGSCGAYIGAVGERQATGRNRQANCRGQRPAPAAGRGRLSSREPLEATAIEPIVPIARQMAPAAPIGRNQRRLSYHFDVRAMQCTPGAKSFPVR